MPVLLAIGCMSIFPCGLFIAEAKAVIACDSKVVGSIVSPLALEINDALMVPIKNDKTINAATVLPFNDQTQSNFENRE